VENAADTCVLLGALYPKRMTEAAPTVLEAVRMGAAGRVEGSDACRGKPHCGLGSHRSAPRWGASTRRHCGPARDGGGGGEGEKGRGWSTSEGGVK